jgi:hypothetical protein
MNFFSYTLRLALPQEPWSWCQWSQGEEKVVGEEEDVVVVVEIPRNKFIRRRRSGGGDWEEGG